MDNIKKRNIGTNGDNEYNGGDFEKDLEDSMLKENNSLIDQIYTNVKNIKRHAKEMNSKIYLSTHQANELDKKYSESTSLISETMKQFSLVLSANSGYWCYLFLFILLIFFILYTISH